MPLREQTYPIRIINDMTDHISYSLWRTPQKYISELIKKIKSSGSPLNNQSNQIHKKFAKQNIYPINFFQFFLSN